MTSDPNLAPSVVPCIYPTEYLLEADGMRRLSYEEAGLEEDCHTRDEKIQEEVEEIMESLMG